MTTLNYFDAVKFSVKEYAFENIEKYSKAADFEELEKMLYDDCFIADEVTGNASGSFTFSTYQAERNLCGNFDLMIEALECFGCPLEDIKRGPEFLDVTIRCYVLGSCIGEYIEELKTAAKYGLDLYDAITSRYIYG